MDRAQQILLPDRAIQSLDAYVASGGGKALAKALTTPREEIIAEIEASGLLGGGAPGLQPG